MVYDNSFVGSDRDGTLTKGYRVRMGVWRQEVKSGSGSSQRRNSHGQKGAHVEHRGGDCLSFEMMLADLHCDAALAGLSGSNQARVQAPGTPAPEPRRLHCLVPGWGLAGDGRCAPMQLNAKGANAVAIQDAGV